MLHNLKNSRIWDDLIILQKFTKMRKTIQLRIRKQQIWAPIRVYSWFPLKKQSQFAGYRPEIRIAKL
jgi:hypothetical protein